jgi:hypothetical protein
MRSLAYAAVSGFHSRNRASSFSAKASTMVSCPCSKCNATSPKQSLNVPDLDNAKSAVLNSFLRKSPSGDTVTRLMSSSTGTVPNLGYRSTEPSSLATEFTWNHANLHRARLTAGSRPSVGLRTKLLIPVSSARILLLASGESKGRRTSAFALVTGSPLNRPKRSGRCLTRIRSRASGIERCSGSCWAAGYAGERRRSLRSHASSDARIIGQSLT